MCIRWALEQPVIVGKRIWDTELRGLLMLPYCSVLFFYGGGPGSIPEPHNSPEDSSPAALPEPRSVVEKALGSLEGAKLWNEASRDFSCWTVLEFREG